MSENILDTPAEEFIEMLNTCGLMDKMYDAMKKDDLSQPVMAALDILDITSLQAEIKKKTKVDSISSQFRFAGNDAFKNDHLRKALIYFNLALLYAQKNSESMVLAYSNRSALLFQVKAISQCMADIATCFAIGCTRDIAEKLLVRKEKCQLYMFQSAFKSSVLISSFGIEYFRLNEKRNKHIPCASTDVEVVVENGIRKVVAAKNIDCGKVVAVEPFFVADPNVENTFITCHYCHKLTFNLHSCEGCCYALFCGDECRKQCMKEYHRVECYLMDTIAKFTPNAKCTMAIRAALKIREMSKSWSDFISASTNIGSRRMEQSTINEIYDVNNKFSMLNFEDKKNFVSGKIFNESFFYACILMQLKKIPGYLPQSSEERTKAMRALARLMSSLSVSFPLELEIQNVAQNHQILSITSEPEPGIGLFSFASKLTHSCEPNIFYVGLNNKLALIASQYIKKGTELTISYLGHWCESLYAETRAEKLYLGSELKCRCRVCVEEWNVINVKPNDITIEQLRCIRKWRATQMNMVLADHRLKFRETCNAFKMFQDDPHTKEYCEVFKQFRNTLTEFQYAVTQNDIL